MDSVLKPPIWDSDNIRCSSRAGWRCPAGQNVALERQHAEGALLDEAERLVAREGLQVRMIGTHSEPELRRILPPYRLIAVWSSTDTVRVDPGDWPGLAVRNGLIAAGVAYLLLILVAVPAMMFKRPD